MKEDSMILGQAPIPLPDGSTPLEKFLLWGLAIAVAIISYFYKSLETKNGREITKLEERINELKIELNGCRAEHERANEQFAALRAELNEIQKQRYKTQ